MFWKRKRKVFPRGKKEGRKNRFGKAERTQWQKKKGRWIQRRKKERKEKDHEERPGKESTE